MTTLGVGPADAASPVEPGERRRTTPARGTRTGSLPPLRGLLPLVVFLASWQLVASRLSPFFPPPSDWASALLDLSRSGVLLPAAFATVITFLLGLVAASVLGTVLGLAVGASARTDRALQPTLEYARAMPPAAVVPIATLLLGFTGTMKVVVVTSAAIWSILLNTRSGVRQLNPVMFEMARSLQLGRFERVRKVTFPALLPSIFLGVRVAAPVALVITLLVEILTQVDGVGALIAQSQRNYEFAQGYGLILVAGLFALLVNALVSMLQARVMRHRPPA
ncbi:MAG: ABC transporter permease [Actinobacteria bacterium]|nr:ABC transporter permease [Actinomycetota bacterium]MBW3646718.1 ABC transporter permease [Actinomycetota bacterium]